MQASDTDAVFRQELLRHVPRLRGFARALTRDRARGDDLAQDALLRAWRARDSFEAGTNMEAWLFRILRNTFVSGIRARRHEEVSADSTHDVAGGDDPSAGVALNDVRQALNRLPEPVREALVLVGAFGWTYEAAAAHANCPVGTMKTRVFRGRRLLARFLEEGVVRRDHAPASQAMGAILASVAAAAERPAEG